MIRPLPLRRYLSVMHAKGHATAAVLAGTGIDAAMLDDPQSLVEVDQYLRLVENMVALTGGEGLGLDVGLERDVKDSGVLGYAALSCRSIRHSVEEFWGGYGGTHGEMARVSIPRSSGREITLGIDARSMSPLGYRFFVEEALCLLIKVGAQVSGVESRFLRLSFSYPAPAYAARYRQIFACPIAFNAPRTLATLDRDWFEAPLKTSDPVLIAMYKQHLLQQQKQIDASSPLHARVFAEFKLCGSSLPPLDDIARALKLSPRTFRRRLHEQKLSYRRLVAEYRVALACESLRAGQATKQVSEAAGFDDVNAFRRAFKNWTGKTVGEFLAEQHAR